MCVMIWTWPFLWKTNDVDNVWNSKCVNMTECGTCVLWYANYHVRKKMSHICSFCSLHLLNLGLCINKSSITCSKLSTKNFVKLYKATNFVLSGFHESVYICCGMIWNTERNVLYLVTVHLKTGMLIDYYTNWLEFLDEFSCQRMHKLLCNCSVGAGDDNEIYIYLWW